MKSNQVTMKNNQEETKVTMKSNQVTKKSNKEEMEIMNYLGISNQ